MNPIRNPAVPPGPRDRLPGMSFLAFRRDALALFLRPARRYGDVAYYRLGGIQLYLFTHPDHVKDVLVTHQRHFTGLAFEAGKSITGEGLLSAQGETHRRHRRILQPAFHRDRIASYGQVMVDHARKWQESRQAREVIALRSEVARLTLGIVGETMFGAEKQYAAQEIREFLDAKSATRVRPHASGRAQPWAGAPDRHPSTARRTGDSSGRRRNGRRGARIAAPSGRWHPGARRRRAQRVRGPGPRETARIPRWPNRESPPDRMPGPSPGARRAGGSSRHRTRRSRPGIPARPARSPEAPGAAFLRPSGWRPRCARAHRDAWPDTAPAHSSRTQPPAAGPAAAGPPRRRSGRAGCRGGRVGPWNLAGLRGETAPPQPPRPGSLPAGGGACQRPLRARPLHRDACLPAFGPAGREGRRWPPPRGPGSRR